MNEEIWKDIEGYEGIYQVSSFGRVRSLDRIVVMRNGRKRPTRGKMLKERPTYNGYVRVQLRADNDYYIHRLVASAFIPNPDNLPQVNHKDENKRNNRADNLEWCDNIYNINYGTAKDRISEANSTRPIKQLTLDEDLVAEYKGVIDAVRKTGYKEAPIRECCNHKRHTSYGFIWEYIDQTGVPPRTYKRNKGVNQYTLDGKLIASFKNSHEAWNATGVFHSNIRKCCRGVYKQAGGYVWRYKH